MWRWSRPGCVLSVGFLSYCECASHRRSRSTGSHFGHLGDDISFLPFLACVFRLSAVDAAAPEEPFWPYQSGRLCVLIRRYLTLLFSSFFPFQIQQPTDKTATGGCSRCRKLAGTAKPQGNSTPWQSLFYSIRRTVSRDGLLESSLLGIEYYELTTGRFMSAQGQKVKKNNNYLGTVSKEPSSRPPMSRPVWPPNAALICQKDIHAESFPRCRQAVHQGYMPEILQCICLHFTCCPSYCY